jgi:hypothetical protein
MTMTRSLARSLILVAATLAAGCGGGEGGPAPGVTLHPVPGCEAIDPAPCDVFDTGCQTRLLALAACMRGSSPGALPPVSRMTEAEFTQYLTARLAAEEPDPDLDHFELGLGMLGLVAPGAFTPSSMAAAQAARVRGFYRHDSDDIVIIDHGTVADDIQTNGVMLHEFVHALQDRDHDLTVWFDEHEDSYDSALAARSVVEGEARFHQERFGVSLLGLDPNAVDLSVHFNRLATLSTAWIRAQPSPYLASFSSFPYEFGGQTINSRFAARGTAIVAELFASPFANTHTLLVYHDDAIGIAGPTLVAPVPPPEWVLTQQTTLGAWLTYVFLAIDDLDGLPMTHALRWRADRVWIYGSAIPGSRSTVVVWTIAFAEAETAATVAAYLELRLRSDHIKVSGSDVTIVETNTTLPVDWALAATAASAAMADTDTAARTDGPRWWPRGNRPMLP